MSSAPPTEAPLVVPGWANGPDGSANGGYASGLLAARLGDAQWDGGAVVNLRWPPPLERTLDVLRDDGGAALRVVDPADTDDAGVPRLVLEAAGSDVPLPLEVPADVLAVDPAAAREAAGGFPFRERHPFPHCLCCGVRRPAGDARALRLHAGPVTGATVQDDSGAQVPVHAALWEVGEEVDTAYVWSALDCPSATPFADPDRPAVLARFEVRLGTRPPAPGEQVRIAAWERARDGRKLHSSSAALAADGTVLAVARALWIEVRPR